jgi:membrane protein YqaA with SNARE-associated domain
LSWGAAVIEALWPYLLLASLSFAGATLLPVQSELALLAQLKLGLGAPWLLVLAATIGNVGGSLLNWWIGGELLRFQDRAWFPFKPAQIEDAATRFRRFGVWSLLLSWLPVIGDPLTVVAGVLRVPLGVFLPLVTIGKAGRYAVVAWLAG